MSTALVSVAVLDTPVDAGFVQSTHIATPSFVVTASGWAPPMPPSYGEGDRAGERAATVRMAAEAASFFATAPKVS